MDIIKKRRDEALKGRKLWIKIKEKYQVSNDDAIILVGNYNDEIGEEVIRQLDIYLRRKYLRRAIVIVCEANYSTETSNVFYHIESEDNIKCIEQYYRLSQFAKNIIVTSGEQPFGGIGIVGKNNVSLADYVADAILV